MAENFYTLQDAIKNGKLTYVIDENGNRIQLLPETSTKQVKSLETLTINLAGDSVGTKTALQTALDALITGKADGTVNLQSVLADIISAIYRGTIAANISLDTIEKEDITGKKVTLATTNLQTAIEELFEKALNAGVTGVRGENTTEYKRGEVELTAEDIGAVSYHKEQTLDEDAKQTARKNIGLNDTDNKIPNALLHIDEDGGMPLLEEDASGNLKLPSKYLPSYVDDVLEGYIAADRVTFYKDADETDAYPPETGKIYVDLATNKTYRWSGTQYSVVSETLAIGETTGTAYDGGKGKKLADDLTEAKDRLTDVETEVNTVKAKIGVSGEDFSAQDTTAQTLIGGINENKERLDDVDDKIGTQTLKTTDKTIIGGINENKDRLDNLFEDTKTETSVTPVAQADKWSTARTISIAVKSGKDANGNNINASNVAKTVDGSANVTYDLELGDSGVDAGVYSAVKVNEKGIVTSGATIIEVGTAADGPSENLAIGGLFIELTD